MRRIFWGFCKNWFLTLPFGPFRFWLRIRGDIRIRKTTPRYHRLSVSVIWGVADSPYRWVGESMTPRITDTESRRLHISLSRGVASLIRGVGDSPHHQYRESAIEFYKRKLSVSSTPRTRLPVSLSRRVADSAYHRYGESMTPRIVESGSRGLRISVIRGVSI